MDPLLTIEQLWTPDAEHRIRADLEIPGDVWILAYNLQISFFQRLFNPTLGYHRVHILADRTQKKVLHQLKTLTPKLQIRIWSKNWVMHAKVIMLPHANVVYVGSPNLTSYSYHRALNVTLRIEQNHFTETTLAKVSFLWHRSAPLE